MAQIPQKRLTRVRGIHARHIFHTQVDRRITMKKLSTLFAFAFALSLVAPAFAEESANAPAKDAPAKEEKKKDEKKAEKKGPAAASEEKKEEAKAEKPAKKEKAKKAEKKEETK